MVTGILVAPTPILPAQELALWFKVSVTPEIQERYIEAVQKSVGETRKEPSRPRFDFYQDTNAPGTFHQFEVWTGQGELDDHLKQPSVQAAWKVRDEGQTAQKEVIKMVPYRGTTTAKAPAGDLSASQNLIVIFEPKEQLKDEFLSEFDKVIEQARKAVGNLAFELSRSVEPSGRFVLFERWSKPRRLCDAPFHPLRRGVLQALRLTDREPGALFRQGPVREVRLNRYPHYPPRL